MPHWNHRLHHLRWSGLQVKFDTAFCYPPGSFKANCDLLNQPIDLPGCRIKVNMPLRKPTVHNRHRHKSIWLPVYRNPTTMNQDLGGISRQAFAATRVGV